MKKPNKHDKKYRKTGMIKSINYERLAFDQERYIEHLESNEPKIKAKCGYCDDSGAAPFKTGSKCPVCK